MLHSQNSTDQPEPVLVLERESLSEKITSIFSNTNKWCIYKHKRNPAKHRDQKGAVFGMSDQRNIAAYRDKEGRWWLRKDFDSGLPPPEKMSRGQRELFYHQRESEIWNTRNYGFNIDDDGMMEKHATDLERARWWKHR